MGGFWKKLSDGRGCPPCLPLWETLRSPIPPISPLSILFISSLIHIILDRGSKHAVYWLEIEGICQERKKFCILYELGNKIQVKSGGHYESLSGFTEEPQGKAPWKITIFSLMKLVWYSFLEIIKLKFSVKSNKKKLLLKHAQPCLLLSLFRSRIKSKSKCFKMIY